MEVQDKIKKLVKKKTDSLVEGIESVELKKDLFFSSEEEKEIDNIFTDFFNYIFLYGEFDFNDSYKPTVEMTFDSNYTTKQKLDFMCKYYEETMTFDSVNELLEYTKKTIAERKEEYKK